ncbi:MAG: hypothetical protein ABEN55_01750 [Bradymonadaceae bacterium]
MDPALLFVIVATLIIALVGWGMETWRDKRLEGLMREYHRKVTAELLEQVEETFGQGSLSPKASPVEMHKWFEGELEGHRVELEVETKSEQICRIGLVVNHETACLPEDVTVYLKSPAGLGFFKKLEAGMIGDLDVDAIDDGSLYLESSQGRTEGLADEIPESLVEVLAAHYEHFHVDPPEELAERLAAADSLQDLEEAYEALDGEEPDMLQGHVPGEVGIRHNRIDVEWLFRGETSNLNGVIAFVKQSLRLADDLERQSYP